MGAEIHRLRGADPMGPFSVEAEQMVIGNLLLRDGAVGMIQRYGGAALFVEPLHARIFEIAAEKDRHGLLVSPVTLASALEHDEALNGLGGAAYLARVAGAATSGLKDYCQFLSEMRAKRDILAAVETARSRILSGEDPAADIAAGLEGALIGVEASGRAAGPVSMLKATTVAMTQIRAAYDGEDDGAVRTGIHALDDMLGGLYPGELILLGGRPSMGKTALALCIATRVAWEGHAVGIVSLEMNPEALAMRALSEATAGKSGNATSYAQMRRGQMSETQFSALADAAKHVATLPIAFLPRTYSDIGALMAGARQLHRTMDGGLRLLIVDYAQLLKSDARNRFEQITEISIALKSLAGQLNVPVLALSQLSRAVEQREDKRPTLSDLRESGQLEQDADAVLFCYRDEYYVERMQPDEDAPPEKHDLWRTAMERSRNRLEIIVAKQRQGQIGTARVRCNPALNLIWEDGR